MIQTDNEIEEKVITFRIVSITLLLIPLHIGSFYRE